MKDTDLVYSDIYSTYQRIGAVQAREKLHSLTIPELIDMCYFIHKPCVGRKSKLIETIITHMEISHKLASDNSVEFFDF